MTNILISWIGETDLRLAQASHNIAGVSPIAQAIVHTNYSAIILVSDYPKVRTDPFLNWLQPQTSTETTFRRVQLSSPTDYQDIHHAASKAIEFAIKEFGKSVNITFHLSPETPAMAAVWLFLSKTRFPAKLIEPSKTHGVRPVSIPFDISADFLPNVGVHVALLKTNHEIVDSIWLESMLNTPYCYLQSQRLTHELIKYLGLKRMVNIKMYLPPLEHQKMFSTIVAAVKKSLTKHLSHAGKSDDLFNSIIRRSFLGRI